MTRQAGAGQNELFPAQRHHAEFTGSSFELIRAEQQHREYAIIERVFSHWNDEPFVYPPGRSPRATWLTCAAIAHNMLRAAGPLARLAHAKARGATIRRDLIDVVAGTAWRGRGHLTLFLPKSCYHEHESMILFRATCGPPTAAALTAGPDRHINTASRPIFPAARLGTMDKSHEQRAATTTRSSRGQ